MPSTSPQLQRFIDDELARAPLMFEQVLQTLIDKPLRFDPTATSAQRHEAMDLHAALQHRRPHLVKAFATTLREQVENVAKEQAAAARGLHLADADELSLSLVEDDEVAVDVELQRAIVVILSSAEFELRELRTFTSALVGDVNLAHDTNPFRPDAFARALLAAVQVLPVPTATQLGVMRLAIPLLADALRKAYAGACTRLESQGVEPAAYRTIVMPPGVQGPRPRAYEPRADLNALRDSMPVPLDMTPEPKAPAPAVSPRKVPDLPVFGDENRARIDQQLIELLTRLFDAILADRSLPPDVQLALSRLQTSAVRVALRDPGMLDSYTHPVWEFMDRLAFDGERLAAEPPARERLLRYAQSLIENMLHEPVQDARLYRWAIERIVAFEDHVLQHHCKQAQAQIDSLRTLALSHASGMPEEEPTQPQALDVGSLETVPAELMDLDAASAHSAPKGLPAVEPGEWLSLFLQGSWRELQVLWRDAHGELWLFRQGSGRTWALRRSALERLHAAGLAEPLSPPSLVQHAAQQVLRQIPHGAH